jgi:hypothetical protein
MDIDDTQNNDTSIVGTKVDSREIRIKAATVMFEAGESVTEIKWGACSCLRPPAIPEVFARSFLAAASP